MNKSKRAIHAALALLIFLFTACAAGVDQESTPTSTPKPPIDLSLKDLQGNSVQLSSLRGEVVLVNYWASWCSPCREEMPILDEFYKEHQSEGFMLIAVNVSESAEDAAEYVAEHGYSFTVWSDPPGDTMIELGINGLPASLLLDETGRIQKVWLGSVTEEILETSVFPLLYD